MRSGPGRERGSAVLAAAASSLGLYVIALTLWPYEWYGRVVAIIVGLLACVGLEVVFGLLVLPDEARVDERQRYSFAEVLAGVPARVRARSLASMVARTVSALVVLLVLLWTMETFLPRLPWLAD
jgi:hypothetical protein